MNKQVDGEYKTEKSCETCKHYGVFSLECGRCDNDMTNYAPKQADGEKTCGTCRNEDTYHCAECENKSDHEQAQADGEYIRRQQAMSDYADWYGYDYQNNWFYKHLKKLPSVAIPPDHDGCKDCVYQDNPQDAMPCRECKHNYMDKFERAKVGHWKEYSSNWLCDYCNRLVSERSDYCPHCGAKMGGEEE